MSRISEASGRQVIYNVLRESVRAPGGWKKHLEFVEESCRQGARAVPLCSPNSVVSHFNMKNCQIFRQLPNWLSLINVSDAEKLQAYGDPEIRQKLRLDLQAPVTSDSRFVNRWDLVVVAEPCLPENQGLKGKTIAELAEGHRKDPLDVFLDLAVEEKLNTVFALGHNNMDRDAVAEFLRSPYTVVGLSDGGAHVQYHCEVGYSTRLLGYWVREQGAMSLEHAVRRLTFDSASVYGIYDRGMLRPGLAADIVVFDPQTVRPGNQEVVHDFPNNGWRMRSLAEGIEYTVVNGEVLLERGTYMGATPGRVIRNARYHALQNGCS